MVWVNTQDSWYRPIHSARRRYVVVAYLAIAFSFAMSIFVTGSSDSTTKAIHEILLEIFLPLLDEECVSDLLEKSGRHSLIVEARVFDLFRQGRLQRIPAVSDHKENQVIVAKLAR